MRVFLGGTCAGSKWRKDIEPMLVRAGLDFFNPIVDDWDEEAQKREIEERNNCDFVLYTITPKMEGVYSIAEVVDDSNKRPQKTILVILYEDDGKTFSEHQKKSLKSLANMVQNNDAQVFFDLDSAVLRMARVRDLFEKGESNE
jgi:hypothetical protein